MVCYRSIALLPPPHDDNSVSCLAFLIAFVSLGFLSLPLLCCLSSHTISVPCMDVQVKLLGRGFPHTALR